MPPWKIVPRLGLGVGLGLVLGLGGGQFSLGAIVLELFKTPCVATRQHMSKKSFDLFLSCEFCKSVKSTYLVKHIDWYQMTTKNYYPLCETSVFFELGITEGA